MGTSFILEVASILGWELNVCRGEVLRAFGVVIQFAPPLPLVNYGPPDVSVKVLVLFCSVVGLLASTVNCLWCCSVNPLLADPRLGRAE